MTTLLVPEAGECGAGSSEQQAVRPAFLPLYLLLGIAFGFVLSRSEVISWFRIQEMFRFQSFRMYGIIGSAIAMAAISIEVIKRIQLNSVSGERISIPRKELGSGIRYAAGGTIFGLSLIHIYRRKLIRQVGFLFIARKSTDSRGESPH